MRLFALSFALSFATLAAGTAQALSPDCAQAKRAVEQLICKDEALLAAEDRLDGVVKELDAALNGERREKLAAAQRDWVRRRDEACPVTAADLKAPPRTKERAECLTRVADQRIVQLQADLKGERDGVRALPLTITEAEPIKLPPQRAGIAPARRAVQLAALNGRWAKADPATRRPIDDCRTAYLEIGKDGQFALRDPRIETLPLDGRVAFTGGDPSDGVGFAGEGSAPRGTLRLEPGESARLDRVALRLEQPFAFGATFVRCR
ncbi:lysozyme inhibitor LprI family protein [Azospirillum sp.]|uniref:lysozyme inhibitor LprI family protein n=1 Tax=Azospirillum sp. TaxID=34012 RepID=UPI003D75F3B8